MDQSAEQVGALVRAWRDTPGQLERADVLAKLESLPLTVLIDRARQTGGTERRLLAGAVSAHCARLAGQPSRENADILLALIEGEDAARLFQDSGQSCRAAATEALLSMGFPYALEITPESLQQHHGEPVQSFSGFRLGTLGRLLLAGVGALILFAFFLHWHLT